MNSKKLFLLLFLLKFGDISAQKVQFPEPLSERIANYKIEASLDEHKKIINGMEQLTWKNTSDDAISELQFHLYLNAFKNEKSTFMRESNGGKLRGDKMDKEKKENWGNIYITSIATSTGENLYAKMKFIQPDDLNIHDQTVMSVRLSRPIQPNESITLNINFRSKLPKIFARTGFADDYFLVGQWFPKIGVYEKANKKNNFKSGWNCHQFHANTEFYADFGVYDVTLNVPKEFIVGATGKLEHEQELKNNRKLLRFYAEDVHDFAWTASPKFIVKEKMWRHVKLKAMMQPEHQKLAYRYFESAEKALNYFDKTVGHYPYATLTLVDPPIRGSGSGGMEYPTFITCGSYWGIGEWAKFQELVTVHEFGHQYFQGMLASNEFEESWLDEGFNQYMEGRIMDETYGKGSQLNLFGFTIGDVASSRQSYVSMKNPEISEVYRNAWQYPKGAYSIMTYTKTATWMRTLENLIGRSVMNEILQTYFERWKFKHPTATDFTAIVNEIVPKRLGNKFGTNLDWYFEQVLYRSPTCDYAVKTIRNLQKGSKVEVENKGSMYIPTEMRIIFDDNTQQMISWDGKAKSKVFGFDKKIQSVELDPNFKNLMDLNVVNNSKTNEPNKAIYYKYTTKLVFWVQTVLQFFVSFG